MNWLLVVFGVHLILQVQHTSALASPVKWKNITGLDPLVYLRYQTPVGNEFTGVPLYLCRAKHDNHWLPGKLLFHLRRAQYVCFVAAVSQEVLYVVGKDSNIQILESPRGWTDWVPTSNSYANGLPENAVLGGINPSGGAAYICRHKDSDGRLLVGRYSTGDRKCYYPYHGVKQASTNVDILVENKYAVMATNGFLG